MHHHYRFFFFFFFNDTATTEIYTLSLHDALPISKFASIMPFQNLRHFSSSGRGIDVQDHEEFFSSQSPQPRKASRSEEHTSELQSLAYLVCRLLLEKKKKNNTEYRSLTLDYDRTS